jgi:hypothetical protein
MYVSLYLFCLILFIFFISDNLFSLDYALPLILSLSLSLSLPCARAQSFDLYHESAPPPLPILPSLDHVVLPPFSHFHSHAASCTIAQILQFQSFTLQSISPQILTPRLLLLCFIFLSFFSISRLLLATTRAKHQVDTLIETNLKD